MSYHLSIIYCEDVRHEVGSKFTLVGCYNTTMYTNSFPLTLSKFCAHIAIETPAGVKVNDAKVTLFLGSKEIVSQDMDFSLAHKNKEFDFDTDSPVWRVIGGIVMSPLIIEEESIITIRATIDGEEVQGNRLAVRLRENNRTSE